MVTSLGSSIDGFPASFHTNLQPSFPAGLPFSHTFFPAPNFAILVFFNFINSVNTTSLFFFGISCKHDCKSTHNLYQMVSNFKLNFCIYCSYLFNHFEIVITIYKLLLASGTSSVFNGFKLKPHSFNKSNVILFALF